MGKFRIGSLSGKYGPWRLALGVSLLAQGLMSLSILSGSGAWLGFLESTADGIHRKILKGNNNTRTWVYTQAALDKCGVYVSGVVLDKTRTNP